MSNVHINNFGNNWGFYQKQQTTNSQNEKELQKETPVTSKQKGVEADEIFSALSVLGAQNFAAVSGKNQINPADYLSEERIASIEESMKLFERNVEKYAGAIQEEFGDAFSDDVKYALAAEAFSRE